MATRASQIFTCAQVYPSNEDWCSTILLIVRERNAVEVTRVETLGTNEEIPDRDWAKKADIERLRAHKETCS